MGKIGVYICNFNKKDYLRKNLESLYRQTIIGDLEIHVIDNASTDGAQDMVRNEFPEVELIVNEHNEGGAGGFYKAQKLGKEKCYEYILLLDNDIVLAENAIEELYKFLLANEDVGMVGAITFLMDEPNKIWVYGNTLDFENYRIIDGFSGKTENDNLPEVVYCDTVPACCSLVRASCLEKVGYMPKDNFISWDDIEWCWRFRINNYKIAAISKAKVWHKTAGRVLTNHFSTYYYNRNRINFFAHYIEKKDVERFIDIMLADFFKRIYGLTQKKQKNCVSTIMYAFDDFLNGVRGKADEYKIKQYDEPWEPFADVKNTEIELICDCTKYQNCMDTIANAIYNLKILLGSNTEIKIDFRGDKNNISAFKRLYKQKFEEELKEGSSVSDCLFFYVCDHVNNIKEYNYNYYYSDEYCNLIMCEDDYHYFKNYDYAFRNFKMMYKDMFMHVMERMNN